MFKLCLAAIRDFYLPSQDADGEFSPGYWLCMAYSCELIVAINARPEPMPVWLAAVTGLSVIAGGYFFCFLNALLAEGIVRAYRRANEKRNQAARQTANNEAADLPK